MINSEISKDVIAPEEIKTVENIPNETEIPKEETVPNEDEIPKGETQNLTPTTLSIFNNQNYLLLGPIIILLFVGAGYYIYIRKTKKKNGS